MKSADSWPSAILDVAWRKVLWRKTNGRIWVSRSSSKKNNKIRGDTLGISGSTVISPAASFGHPPTSVLCRASFAMPEARYLRLVPKLFPSHDIRWDRKRAAGSLSGFPGGFQTKLLGTAPRDDRSVAVTTSHVIALTLGWKGKRRDTKWERAL